jgi:hypothetical protein
MAPFAVGLALGPLLLGCNSRTATGEVGGTVTFKGNLVREGRITFLSDSGPSDEGLLKPDGSYVLERPLPIGDYKVTIEPLIIRRRVDPRGPEVGDYKPAPDIPERYRTLGATDLKATVKEGKNELSFDMKP